MVWKGAILIVGTFLEIFSRVWKNQKIVNCLNCSRTFFLPELFAEICCNICSSSLNLSSDFRLSTWFIFILDDLRSIFVVFVALAKSALVPRVSLRRTSFAISPKIVRFLELNKFLIIFQQYKKKQAYLSIKIFRKIGSTIANFFLRFFNICAVDFSRVRNSNLDFGDMRSV